MTKGYKLIISQFFLRNAVIVIKIRVALGSISSTFSLAAFADSKRFQKRKKADDMTVFFTLLGSYQLTFSAQLGNPAP